MIGVRLIARAEGSADSDQNVNAIHPKSTTRVHMIHRLSVWIESNNNQVVSVNELRGFLHIKRGRTFVFLLFADVSCDRVDKRLGV